MLHLLIETAWISKSQVKLEQFENLWPAHVHATIVPQVIFLSDCEQDSNAHSKLKFPLLRHPINIILTQQSLL